MGHYHYDGEEWCEQCLPVEESAEEVDYDTGEQDSPAHCAGCGQFLDCSLTTDGVDYVIERLIDAMESGIDDHVIPMPGTGEEDSMSYYAGCPHYEIMRDWAKGIDSYSLDFKDKFIVNRFLEECDRLDAQRVAKQ